MTHSFRSTHYQAIFMLLLTNLFWGLSFPVVKALSLLHAQLIPGISSWFSSLYCVAPRFLLAALFMMAIQARHLWQITRGEWQQGVIIGLFSAAGMLLQNDGLHYTEASTSAFLTQLYAILIPVVIALRHRRNPGASVWVSCVLVLAGVAILGKFNWETMRFGRGEAETLLSSVFFMGQILGLGWKRFEANRAGKITLVMFGTQAVVFCGLAFVSAPDLETLLIPWKSVPWVGLTLALTGFCTITAFYLMNIWQPKISTTEAGLIYCVEPIFGSLMALFLPALISIWAAIDYANETATWTLVVGGALITLANVIIQLHPPRTALLATPLS